VKVRSGTNLDRPGHVLSGPGRTEAVMSIRPPHRRDDRPRPTGPGSSSRPPRTLTGPPPFPRYKVLLLRAAGHDLMAVARAVMDLTRFGSAEAEFRMWESHHRGRSLVVVTHLERAELYVEQFAERGLAATIELA